MKQDPPSCSIARLEYFFWMKTLSLAKTRKQTKPKPPEGRRKRGVANTREGRCRKGRRCDHAEAVRWPRLLLRGRCRPRLEQDSWWHMRMQDPPLFLRDLAAVPLGRRAHQSSAARSVAKHSRRNKKLSPWRPPCHCVLLF